MSDTSLIFNVLAKDRASQVFGRVAQAAKVAMIGAGIAAVGFAVTSVKAAAEAETAQLKLTDAFEKFPALADTNISRLRKLNSALALKTKFDDDATAAGQASLAMFKFTGRQVETLTPLMQDFAAKTGMGMDAAAKVFGRAMLGQGRGLKAVGINFKDTGTAAGNYAQLVQGLREKVGGFAQKEGKTFAGRLEILKNQFGEFQELVGGAILPILMKFFDGIRALISAFREGDVTSDGFVGKMEQLGVIARNVWATFKTQLLPIIISVGKTIAGTLTGALSALWPVVKSVAGGLGSVIGWLVRGGTGAMAFKAVIVGLVASFVAWKIAVTAIAVVSRIAAAAQMVWNLAMMANPIGLIILAVIALVAAFIYLWTHSAAFRNFFIGMWNHIWGFMKAIGAWFAGPFVNFFVRAWQAIVSGFKGAINFMIRGWNALDFGIHVHIPSWIPGVGGKGFDVDDLVPDIPYLDKGGTIERTGIAVVHRGETVVPAGSGTQVHFSGDTDAAFASAFMKLVRAGKITISSRAVTA